MKKIAVCALALILTFVTMIMTGCGGTDSAAVDTVELLAQMSEACELPKMLSISSGDSREKKGFAAVSDMGYDKVAQYSLSYAEDGSAYELAVIRMKDSADARALEESLKKHIEKRVEQYKYYDAAQVSRAEDATVAVNGAYVALIMCDNNAEAKAIFENAVR